MKKILFLLAISSAAQSNQLDDLIDASSGIVNQIDTGIKLVGAATEYAYNGDALSNGTLSGSAHISTEQLEAYNNALTNMSSYMPYGDLQTVLENKAADELVLMNDAVDSFTEVVVEMIQVVEVAELAEAASVPSEKEEMQTYVAENQEILTISQDQVDTYNQSIDDIETHANNASAYLAVAGNEDAVEFFEQSIENADTTAEETTIFYDATMQWVSMGYNTTRNLSAVYLNGQDDIGLDLYVTEADVLLAGSESEYYLTSPVVLGYNCFMYEEDCE